MNKAKQIVLLANELEKTYLQIKALGGSLLVLGENGETIKLGELRRGDAVTHSAKLLPTDFLVSVGDNKWGE